MIVSHLLLILHKKNAVLYVYVWSLKCGNRSQSSRGPNTFARHCISFSSLSIALTLRSRSLSNTVCLVGSSPSVNPCRKQISAIRSWSLALLDLWRKNIASFYTAQLSICFCLPIYDARRTGLSVSRTATLLGLSHSTVSRVYQEWSTNQRTIQPTWHNCGKHWSQHSPASLWNAFDAS